MLPLETLDQYMTTCIAACVMYAFFMLFLLVCFLRKFNNSDSINSLVCPPPIELHTVTNPYRYSSVSQNPQVSTYMQPSRSNRSCTSSRQSSNVYKVQLKKVPFGGIDMSQMERLATL
ncbi:hypothetical protein J6590_064827 [Homalodisca vitripennis]|nr:hypothetical protein J6590_064827 [Homalodisca vitripennis]